jgi:membrane-associated protease RseP (regulator of RpoE activity)
VPPSDEPIDPIDPIDQYEPVIPKPLPPPHGRLWVQVVLFALTLVTTTFVGADHYASFSFSYGEVSELMKLGNGAIANAMAERFSLVQGFWYSLTILGILGCHEMGHYLTSLRYNILATRPYFLPLPSTPLTPLTGTLGAFIRVKSRFPDKRALFDVGVAGPIAGFIVAVPTLFAGLMLSRVEQLPPDYSSGIWLGEPLLFKFAQWMVWGRIADGYSVNMHPMAFGAWFGLLATALNLFPFGQLDGGHISYSVFGRRAVWLTYLVIPIAIGLTILSLSWLVWTALMLVMIGMIGSHHPPTLNDDLPLGTGRMIVAAIALVIFILCFTPAPISFL